MPENRASGGARAVQRKHASRASARKRLGQGPDVSAAEFRKAWKRGKKPVDALDESIANLMCEVASRGYLPQMTITYDRWFFNPRGPATAENPQLLNQKVGLGYLFESFAPRLERKGFRAQDLETMLVANPQRILAF